MRTGYKILAVVSLLLMAFTGVKDKRATVKVLIFDNSVLKIEGKTNVNSFTCSYSRDLPKDSLRVTVDYNGRNIILRNAGIKVRVEHFKCANAAMTEDFRELLKAEDHPYIHITAENIRPIEESQKATYSGHDYLVNAKFAIAGEEKLQKVPVDVDSYSGLSSFSGKHSLNIREFNIQPPEKFMGLVKVDEEVAVNFQLKMKLVEEEL